MSRVWEKEKKPMEMKLIKISPFTYAVSKLLPITYQILLKRSSMQEHIHYSQVYMYELFGEKNVFNDFLFSKILRHFH